MMNQELTYALLAMDAYNRGRQATDGATSLNGIEMTNITSIAGFSVSKAENTAASGFAAATYTGSGQTIIAFRGSDGPGEAITAGIQTSLGYRVQGSEAYAYFTPPLRR